MMAPLHFESARLRLLLTAAIMLNLIIAAVTFGGLWFFKDAMSNSQINIVEKIGTLDKHMAELKSNVHEELSGFTKGNARIAQSTNDTVEDMRSDLEKYAQHIDDQFASLTNEVRVSKEASQRATRAAGQAKQSSQATHAKINKLERVTKQKSQPLIKLFP